MEDISVIGFIVVVLVDVEVLVGFIVVVLVDVDVLVLCVLADSGVVIVKVFGRVAFAASFSAACILTLFPVE